MALSVVKGTTIAAVSTVGATDSAFITVSHSDHVEAGSGVTGVA
jgi:hypothetical protein